MYNDIPIAPFQVDAVISKVNITFLTMQFITTCSILDSEILISSLDLFTCDDVTIAPGPQLQALGLFQRYNTLSFLKKQ